MDGPYRGRLLEFGESVLAHLPEAEKGSGNPAPKLADRWTSAVWLCKSDLTDEHLVRTDEGDVYARSVEIPPAAEPLTLPHEPPEAAEDAEEEPT